MRQQCGPSWRKILEENLGDSIDDEVPVVVLVDVDVVVAILRFCCYVLLLRAAGTDENIEYLIACRIRTCVMFSFS